MRDNKRIQVLWVEDDPMIISDLQEDALEIAEIDLHPFESWEDAEPELERDYGRWDAIILDAKCKYKRTDPDKAPRFLTNVFRRIEYLAKMKNHSIPWYVLSGQGEDEIHDNIPIDIEWDADWERISHRRFYKKGSTIKIGKKEMLESEALFRRIKNQVIHNNPELQIEYDKYPDVFHALDRLGLECEVGFYLMPLLEPIHFHGTKNADYNHRYVDVRKALEGIFRHMVIMGILPPNTVAKNAKKESVNLSWSSLFLGGSQPEDPDSLSDYDSEKKFWTKVERLTEGPIVPKQLADWLKSAIFQTGGAAHTTTADEEMAMNLEKYLPHVGGSPYMLRSLVMGLCDFILWYDNFIKAHPDEEMNALNFWRKRNSKF